MISDNWDDDAPLGKSDHATITFSSMIYREKWLLIEKTDYCAMKGHFYINWKF